MTLITKLATSFTDTTIPKLTKDPVIPATGARLLLDMKSSGTWPSQASTITTSDSIFSLVDNSWPTLSVRGSHTYNSTRGGMQANAALDASTGLWLSNTSTNIINDATASWAVTFWFYRGASHSGSLRLIDDNAFQVQSNNAGPWFWRIFGANGTVNEQFFDGNSYSILRRAGFTVYQDAGNIWRYRTVNNTSVSSEFALSGATNTVGGAGLLASASSTTRPRVFSAPSGFNNVPTDFLFYRFYAENLTLSGRTYQQVFDADWARGNGRFS